MKRLKRVWRKTKSLKYEMLFILVNHKQVICKQSIDRFK